MSCVIIYLELLSPAASSGLPKSVTGSHFTFIRSCFGWGLHGFLCYQKNGSLLHCLSTLTRRIRGRRYISVALSLESPPPDVIRHPALRSPDFPHLTPFGIYQLRLHTLLVQLLNLITKFLFCPEATSDIEAAVSHKLPQYGVLRNILAWNSHKVIQKLQKSLGLHIFRGILRNLKKHRLCIEFQNCKLV